MRFLLAALLAAPIASAVPAQKHWWEEQPLIIVHVVTSTGQITYLPPAEFASRKAAQAYNTEHFEVMNMLAGLDDRGWFFRSRLAGKQNPDYLGQYLPEAHKRGLKVIIYFNVHWYHREFADKHRDWLQVREDGRPIDGVYSTGFDFCLNSPWREWCFQVLRDLAAYPIDGVFYDGPIFFPDTCYCRWCQEKFAKLYGGKLPSKKERRGEGFRKLLDFQVRSMADYLRESRAVLKAANPEIAFYMNGGVRGGNWATARLNRELIAEQDILGSEGGFIYGDLLRTPVWKPGVTARLLETQAGGKPTVIFSAAGHKPWTFSLLPEPELRLLYAGTIASGAGVWFGMWPFEFAQPEMKALETMNRFFARNRDYLQHTRSEATAAIVWSDTTANFYQGSDADLIDAIRVPQRSEVGNLEAEFTGLTDALMRARAPFDVIDDVSLERENLDRYALVILPNTACMSGKSAARLAEYVRRGGNLLATFETSLYDETGVRRRDFALAGTFGVSDGHKIIGPKRWDYMKRQASHPLVAGLDRELLPSPAYHVRVRPAGAEVLLRYTEPLAGTYDGIPPLSEDPALVVQTVGKGRAIYFSGDLGAGIQNFRLPEFLRVAQNAVTQLARPRVAVENAPGSLEVVLRSQNEGRRLILHLINSTGEMTRPIERILPLPNARITVRGAAGMRHVQTLMRPSHLMTERTAGGDLRFALPLVDEYEVVVMDR